MPYIVNRGLLYLCIYCSWAFLHLYLSLLLEGLFHLHIIYLSHDVLSLLVLALFFPFIRSTTSTGTAW